jgi:hypothetical protein
MALTHQTRLAARPSQRAAPDVDGGVNPQQSGEI